jgi:hypothetical protein
VREIAMLFGPFIAAFLIFLVYRWITGEDSLDWRMCILWIIGTWAAGFFVRFVAGVGLLNMESPLPEIFGAAASVAALLVILWYQGVRPAHVWLITGLFLFFRFSLLMLFILNWHP